MLLAPCGSSRPGRLWCRAVDPAALRAEFSGLAQRAYLNAGTCGPLPRSAVRAAAEVLGTAEADGRSTAYMEAMQDLRNRQRAAYAALLRAEEDDVALTTCTSDGMVRVLAGLGLRPGDEVLTAPDEHPGLLGPLATLRDRTGVAVRTAPFARLDEEIGPRTRLVACSHVSWATGAVRPEGLAALGDDVPVLLDGAQGVGAIGVDVRELGCAFYAGAGQKWLCGPVGTGMLWVDPAWTDRVAPLGMTFVNLEEPSRALDSPPRARARRHDAPALSTETCAAAVAAHDTLAAAGWDAVHARARGLAAWLAERLTADGFVVAPRGDTTLVSWEVDDPAATTLRLAAAGVIVRDLPGTRFVRASVGAWNDEDDLDRLVRGLH
jgi:selenocysteine lyase/cysteine desulfurase